MKFQPPTSCSLQSFHMYSIDVVIVIITRSYLTVYQIYVSLATRVVNKVILYILKQFLFTFKLLIDDNDYEPGVYLKVYLQSCSIYFSNMTCVKIVSLFFINPRNIFQHLVNIFIQIT